MTRVDVQFQSVERIEEYCGLEPEGKQSTTTIDDPDWPHEGRIVFDHVSARYRPFVPTFCYHTFM